MLTSTPPEGKDSAAKAGSQALNPGSLNAATKFSGAGRDSAVNKGEVTGVLTQTVADSPSSFTAGGHGVSTEALWRTHFCHPVSKAREDSSMV